MAFSLPRVGSQETGTPSDPEPVSENAISADFAKNFVDALESVDKNDAVRILLRAVEQGELPSGTGLVTAVRTQLGDHLYNGLISAAAAFPCFQCSRGFLSCAACDGTGKAAEDDVCRTCNTFGSTPCDFCAGSGLAGYGFFPSGIELEIAAARLTMAVNSLNSLGTHGLVDGSNAQVPGAYRRLVRIRGIFANALQLMRDLRNQDRGVIAQVVTTAWRGLARTENDLGHALIRLAAIGAEGAPATGSAFQDERRCLLEAEAAQLAESARCRAQRLKHLAS